MKQSMLKYLGFTPSGCKGIGISLSLCQNLIFLCYKTPFGLNLQEMIKYYWIWRTGEPREYISLVKTYSNPKLNIFIQSTNLKGKRGENGLATCCRT